MIFEEEDYIAHYGTPRHSGRYPWGTSGWGDGEGEEDTPQRNPSLLDMVKQLKKEGLTETEIATALGIGTYLPSGEFKPSTTDLRALKSIERNAKRQAMISQAWALKEKGLGHVAAARQMGIPESTFRSLLKEGAAEKADILTSTANMLRRQVEEKKFVDIGVGVELYPSVGVSKDRLNTAVAILRQEGYVVHPIKIPQLSTNKETNVKVLCPPGTTWGELKRNQDNIRQIEEFSDDGGRTFNKPLPPLAINPKRVQVVYKEQGGDKADGLIYVRPGKEDISLGGSPYAQVRIQVGKGHYLKGMAIYKDDLPEGVDLLFHTNKSDTGNKLDAMKPLKTDTSGNISETLPFGSVVRQLTRNGKVVSAMNLLGVKETSGIEGDWDTWSSTLSAQLLSKQGPKLATNQLDITYNQKKKDLEEILSLTNPVVKRRLLLDFADGADAAAVHLKAAHMPRQATKVILPINSLKDNEVYAPSFRSGETVVLIRYPHAGPFEIPELKVNNRNREAVKLLGDAKDAIGINANVAQHLSGADFDGDTVIVIPNEGRHRIKNRSPLEGLKDFDPRTAYPGYPGMKQMSAKTKGVQMGMVSNLITDMTIRKAPHSEIVRAVRHSMAVIDAEKHPIDWKRSAEVNGIQALVKKYQTPYREKARGGASTLISRAGSEIRLPERTPRPMKDGGPIDKRTGKKVYVPTGKTYVDKHGHVVPKLETHELLAVTDNAYDLSSGTPIETVYAAHSNRLKALANEARKESLKTPRLKMSDSAKKTYAEEVRSLNSKLAIAQRNAPRERQAQVVGNAMYRAAIRANPDLENSTKKKLKNQMLDTARVRTGAAKTKIKITQEEWDAIQHGAISSSKLEKILDNADPDVVKALASPRTQKLMTSAKTSQARQLLSAGYTRAEVADKLGVSLSTLDAATNV